MALTNYSYKLRKKLLAKSIEYCKENNLENRVFNSALIFNEIKDNFHQESYRNIMNTPEYKDRLNKKHPFFKQENIKELQSSASSDALLMNIFCFPKLQTEWKGIRNLLNVNSIKSIEFGFIPNIEKCQSMRKTEVDMKIDNILFEAKLTEASFTSKDYSTLINKYPQAEILFELDKLRLPNKIIDNYQLIRNIIAAQEKDYRFILLLHSDRTDLIRSFYKVYDSIKSEELKKRVSFITWQEIAACVRKELNTFLKRKYDI